MTVTQQSSAGMGAPVPQYHEPPQPPPQSTPLPRRKRRRPRVSVVPFPVLRQRHGRTHGGRRHA